MRYLIQFADKSTKRVNEAEAKAVMEALSKSKPVILRGAFISDRFISCVKPISKEWYDPEFVQVQERSETVALPSITQQNSDFLGFTDAKLLHEQKDVWKKAV